MRFRRILLPIASTIAIGGITAWEFASSRTGPGPLHPAHSELDGFLGSDCSSCHEAGIGIAADGCIKCHEPIGEQRSSGTGLHGSLPRERLDDCSLCHSEHHGAETPLIAPQAFSNAGVVDVATYDHRHVPDYHLHGAHLALDCDRCHPAANSAQPPQKGRFLGAQQGCTSCHEDVHRGAFGKNCEECHGQELKFRSAPGFKHEIFPLVASHSRVDCVKCHEPGTVHDTAALAKKPQKARVCNECHEDAHRTVGQRVAKAILLRDTADCKRCHGTTKFKEARVTPEKHAEFGFPLRGGHAQAECVTCHGDGTHPSRHGVKETKVESCGRCHADPHEQKFVAAAVAAAKGPAESCGGCHQDADPDFRKATTTPQQHAVTGFPLAVPHAQVECAKCHKGDDHAVRFPGRKPSDCRACHQDEHRGQFDHDERYAQCTACHEPVRFAPNAFGTERHAGTAFPLTGSHDAVTCVRCHKDVDDGVRKFHGTPQDCQSCHEDVHKGSFDVIGKPQKVEGRTGCARCHDTDAFAPVRNTVFDHGKWTGYVIDGAHTKVECVKCHVPTKKDRNRRLGKVKGKQCSDCHQDQHQGQFATDGGARVDCTRCHDTGEFKKTRFDHDRDSRFKLDAQHAPLPCDKCHRTYQSVAGPVVRYKPLGTQCGDCHRLGAKGQVEGTKQEVRR